MPRDNYLFQSYRQIQDSVDKERP